VKDRVPAAVFLVFGVALGQAATAAVIYDSGVAISEINHGGYSCSNCPGSFETADRFVLNVADNTTVTDVHWWGMYFNASTTQADSFEIRIYTDNPSNPGLPTNVGTEISLAAVASGGRVATGEVVATGGGLGSSIMAGLPIFGYSAVLATPFEAAVGTTYWGVTEPGCGCPRARPNAMRSSRVRCAYTKIGRRSESASPSRQPISTLSSKDSRARASA